MRTTYKWTDGQLRDRDGFPLLNQAERAREEICMPYVMSDIPEYRNMVDGKPIGSRSEHREFLKIHNLVEVGNQGLEPAKRKTHAKHEIAGVMKEAIEQLEAGHINPDEGLLTPEMEADLARDAASDLDAISVSETVETGDFVRAENSK